MRRLRVCQRVLNRSAASVHQPEWRQESVRGRRVAETSSFGLGFWWSADMAPCAARAHLSSLWAPRITSRVKLHTSWRASSAALAAETSGESARAFSARTRAAASSPTPQTAPVPPSLPACTARKAATQWPPWAPRRGRRWRASRLGSSAPLSASHSTCALARASCAISPPLRRERQGGGLRRCHAGKRDPPFGRYADRVAP